MSAYLSADRVYRYSLMRDVAPLTGVGSVAFVGLNPSTADETQDDPTIRRCIRFARDWGYAQLLMLNLYAFRATDPVHLWRARRDGVDVVGPENLETVARVAGGCDLVVCAWGACQAPAAEEHIERVLALLPDPHCIGLTKGGAPRHPLYVLAATRPQAFRAREPEAASTTEGTGSFGA